MEHTNGVELLEESFTEWFGIVFDFNCFSNPTYQNKQ